MKSTKKRSRGYSAFCEYFEDAYKDRWPSLLNALVKEPLGRALVNPFASLSADEQSQMEDITAVRCPQPFVTKNGLYSHYALDPASVLAANALPIKANDKVLDMCSAPGGKALSLIFREIKDTSFVLNERSATRRARLRKVLSEYLPASIAKSIVVSGHDATRWGLHEKEVYDAVLLDAPCSSERHLVQKPQLIESWTKKRSQRLALQQFAMLAAASDAVKPGGHILYATCSISNVENDQVVHKLLKRRSGFRIENVSFDTGEKTQHGWIFLPDRSGMGPLYLSLIIKEQS